MRLRWFGLHPEGFLYVAIICPKRFIYFRFLIFTTSSLILILYIVIQSVFGIFFPNKKLGIAHFLGLLAVSCEVKQMQEVLSVHLLVVDCSYESEYWEQRACDTPESSHHITDTINRSVVLLSGVAHKEVKTQDFFSLEILER